MGKLFFFLTKFQKILSHLVRSYSSSTISPIFSWFQPQNALIQYLIFFSDGKPGEIRVNELVKFLLDAASTICCKCEQFRQHEFRQPFGILHLSIIYLLMLYYSHSLSIRRSYFFFRSRAYDRTNFKFKVSSSLEKLHRSRIIIQTVQYNKRFRYSGIFSSFRNYSILIRRKCDYKVGQCVVFIGCCFLLHRNSTPRALIKLSYSCKRQNFENSALIVIQKSIFVYPIGLHIQTWDERSGEPSQ